MSAAGTALGAWSAPATLAGRWVRLEPLAERHAAELADALADEEVCRFLLFGPAQELEQVRAILRSAVEAAQRGEQQAFAIVWADTGRAIGSTRLLDLAPRDRRAEIGSSFLARAWWGSQANAEAKRLLLEHAFATLGCLRVALKTDARNLRAQRAIEALGAQREGVLRRHMQVKGFQRDTVYYSILAEEWPAVRERLSARLGID